MTNQSTTHTEQEQVCVHANEATNLAYLAAKVKAAVMHTKFRLLRVAQI